MLKALCRSILKTESRPMLKSDCRSILKTGSRPMLQCQCRPTLILGFQDFTLFSTGISSFVACFPIEVHIRLFGVDRYLVDVVDRYLITDLSSLLSSSKLMSEMDSERPSRGVHQDLVNVLGMVLAVVDRCSSVVVDRCSHVAVDRLHCVVVDRCCPF
ncbi:hypothetical protein F2Q69_00029448 [Brassica cretica]|uniref:Uncharacterized protein n=1 Tax=Brassica cretica TaxID=69181 RepID=A0A8S9SA11_BRACR|nr:hypothetical protein F2Q69_00029448 [Brassica cretica]